jgi:hypothetical protein
MTVVRLSGSLVIALSRMDGGSPERSSRLKGD